MVHCDTSLGCWCRSTGCCRLYHCIVCRQEIFDLYRDHHFYLFLTTVFIFSSNEICSSFCPSINSSCWNRGARYHCPCSITLFLPFIGHWLTIIHSSYKGVGKLHVSYTRSSITILILRFQCSYLMTTLYFIGKSTLTSITVVIICNCHLICACSHYITVVTIRIWGKNIGSP